jgi:hypothetical protein
MTNNSSLNSLLRLRSFEILETKRILAERNNELNEAEERLEDAVTALREEAGYADVSDYAAWLQRGLAHRERAKSTIAVAKERVEIARGLMAEARAAERSVEEAILKNKRVEATRIRRKTQISLDDLSGKET